MKTQTEKQQMCLKVKVFSKHKYSWCMKKLVHSITILKFAVQLQEMQREREKQKENPEGKKKKTRQGKEFETGTQCN